MSRQVILGVDLQSGFKNDTVVVEVNGKEVFRGEHVQTRGPSGFAQGFTTIVETGMISVRVKIVTRNLERVVDYHVSKDRYLGFFVVDSFIDSIPSDTPFVYF